MIGNQALAWKARNPHIHNELQRLRPFCQLVLFILASLWCIPAAAQSYAYVPTHKSNSVSVINTATNSVVAVVPVGIQTLQAAISPDGAFAYVTNSGWFYANSDVSVMNTATRAVVATVPVGTNPWGVVVTPNGAFAYVTNQATNDVSVISTATNAVLATISVGSNPLGLAITPDGASAYI